MDVKLLGMTTDFEDIEEEEIPVRRRRGCGFLFFLIMTAVAAGYGGGLGVFLWMVEDARTTVRALDEYRPRMGSKVYSSDGDMLGEFSVMKRDVVGINQIPLSFQQAVIATEDDEFYTHRGVRPLAYLSVFADFLRTGKLRGGSTITMQVVRGVGEWHVTDPDSPEAERKGEEVQVAAGGPLGVGKERKFARKLREILVSLQVEREFTKDELLEIYLNGILLGLRAEGVQAGSQQYFAKDCSELTLGESALLAGLIRSPNNQQPFRHPDLAISRRNIVLKQMLELNYITPDQYEAALKERLEDSLMTPERRAQLAAEGKGPVTPDQIRAPHFVEEIRLQIQKEAMKRDVFQEGLEIQTTLDLRIQQAAEQTLTAALEAFDDRKLKALKSTGHESEFVPVSGAILCIDNRPGYKGFVRAMVSRNLEKPKFNCTTLARRQPGSSVKPFIWAAAIANGMTASTIENDSEFVRVDRWGNRFSPKNFDGGYLGPVTLRTALQKSVNVVSVKLLERLTVPVVGSYMQRTGIYPRIDKADGLALALGSKDVTVMNLCVAYSAFANMGVRYDPIIIDKVKSRDGLVLYDCRDHIKSEQAMPAPVAYVMTHLMQGVCKFGTGAGGGVQAKWEKAYPDRPRAGKTGTSNDSRNVWFCGFTPDFTCVVWVGYSDNRPLGSGRNFTGGHIANPIWTDFMIEAEKGIPVRGFEQPDGVVMMKVDRATGQRGGDFEEAFVKGTAPPLSTARPESSELDEFNARLLDTL